MGVAASHQTIFQIFFSFLSLHLKTPVVPASNFATVDAGMGSVTGSIFVGAESNLLSVLHFLDVALHPCPAEAAAARGTAQVLVIVFPWLSRTDQLASIVTVKFLGAPIVPVPGACEIMYPKRILDSHSGPPSATWYRIFREQEMVNKMVNHHRWVHRVRMFRRETRRRCRASVDLSDPYGVRSPSPWSSEFDSTDSEIQWTDQHW